MMNFFKKYSNDYDQSERIKKIIKKNEQITKNNPNQNYKEIKNGDKITTVQSQQDKKIIYLGKRNGLKTIKKLKEDVDDYFENKNRKANLKDLKNVVEMLLYLSKRSKSKEIKKFIQNKEGVITDQVKMILSQSPLLIKYKTHNELSKFYDLELLFKEIYWKSLLYKLVKLNVITYKTFGEIMKYGKKNYKDTYKSFLFMRRFLEETKKDDEKKNFKDKYSNKKKPIIKSNPSQDTYKSFGFMRKFVKKTKKDDEQKNFKDKFSNKRQTIIKSNQSQDMYV